MKAVFHVVLCQLKESPELSLFDDFTFVIFVKFQMLLDDLMDLIGEIIDNFSGRFMNIMLLCGLEV